MSIGECTEPGQVDDLVHLVGSPSTALRKGNMESDEDATLAHFTHREEFFQLLDQVLTLPLTTQCTSLEQQEVEENQVQGLGSIVRRS